MQLLHSYQKINELLTSFVLQVKGAAAMRHLDINLISETILIPLLSEVYGYKNLTNLNTKNDRNYPGIDLGDKVAKVAFQITSTSGSEKVKETLRKFIDYKLYETYDRLIIYIISEKQKTYSGSGYDEIVDGKFNFNKDKDIIDYRDLLSTISNLQINQTRRIENILEANFGKHSIPLWDEPIKSQQETVFLNLMPVSFPKTIYIADIDTSTIQSERSDLRAVRGKNRRHTSTRAKVLQALEQQGLKFGVDWVCHEQKIITFHDLTNHHLPLSSTIDPGTVTALDTEDFYGINEDYERVFKFLLKKCLQQKLYPKGVKWQYEDQVFIFSPLESEEERKEKWKGKKISRRDVYSRVLKNNKPDEALHHKHLAFHVEYKIFNKKWYISIRPDWFFSFDGYRKSFYAADRIKWLKRNENNGHVTNHVRFISYFLREEKPADLFSTHEEYPFLSFNELVSFDNAPALNDKEWVPSENKKLKSNTDDRQTSLSLEEE